MTTPTPPAKGKIAGFALLGVAAVAATMGIVTVASGDDSRNTAQRTTTSQSPGNGGPGGPGTSRKPGGGAPNGPSTAPGKPPAGPGGSGGQAPGGGNRPGKGGPNAPTTKVIQAPQPNANPNPNPNPAPEQRQPQPPQPAGQPVAQHSAAVRIYNNGTIRGMAERAAGRLRADGYRVVTSGNYSQGIIPTTTVYYRPGTAEKATARSIGDDIGARVKPRFTGIRDASPGVILILTDDYES